MGLFDTLNAFKDTITGTIEGGKKMFAFSEAMDALIPDVQALYDDGKLYDEDIALFEQYQEMKDNDDEDVDKKAEELLKSLLKDEELPEDLAAKCTDALKIKAEAEGVLADIFLKQLDGDDSQEAQEARETIKKEFDENF